jgi:hypothetical protein
MELVEDLKHAGKKACMRIRHNVYGASNTLKKSATLVSTLQVQMFETQE